MEIDWEKFRNRLLEISNAKNQKALCAQLTVKGFPISESTFSKILNGSRDLSVQELAQIADIYNVSTDYLLGIDDRKPKNEKPITSRDICRMLVKILDTNDIKLTIEEHEVTEEELKKRKAILNQWFSMNEHIATITFPNEISILHITGTLEAPVVQGALINTDINDFLYKYSKLKDVDGLTEDDKRTLIDKYIDSVPDTIIPDSWLKDTHAVNDLLNLPES